MLRSPRDPAHLEEILRRQDADSSPLAISAIRLLGHAGLSETHSLSDESKSTHAPHLTSAHSQCPWHHSESWTDPLEELPASYHSKEPRQHEKFSLETDSVEKSTQLRASGKQQWRLQHGWPQLLIHASPHVAVCCELCTGKDSVLHRLSLKNF